MARNSFPKHRPPNPPVHRIHRLFCWALWIIAIGVLFYSPRSGLSQTLSPSASRSAPSPFSAPSENPAKGGEEGFWQAYQESLKKGAWESGIAELEKLYQWKLDRGIRNHYGYATALIRESRQPWSSGQKERVPVLLQYAEKMAPDFSQVHYAQAAWRWAEKSFSPVEIAGAVNHGFRGLWLSLSNPEEGLSFAANLVFWILGSVFLLMAVFSFYLLLRYHSFFAHHLGHWIRIGVDPKMIRGFALLILFLPFLLGIGWMWLFAFWFLVFGVYANASDRRAMIFILLLSLILPMGLRWYGSCLTSMTNPGFMEIARANRGAWNPALYQTLENLRRKNPSDPQILQATGLVAKRMGEYGAAEQRFLEWTELNPGSAAAFTNLGNVFFATQRLDPAAAAYKKAIDLDSSHAEAHYNLGQVYLQKLQLNEAESHFLEARSLAPDLISYYNHIASRNANRLMIDPTLKPLDLWERVWNEAWKEESITPILWAGLWEGIPLALGEVVLILLLLAVMGMPGLLGERFLIRSCESCGQIMCSLCRRSMMTGQNCYQCRKIFSNKPSGDPQIIAKKKTEVARYRDRQKSIPVFLSRIVPGVGHLFRGRSLEGAFSLFLFILLIVKLGLGSGWMPSPMVVNVPFVLPGMILTSLLLIGIYGWVQFRMKRLAGQGGKI